MMASLAAAANGQLEVHQPHLVSALHGVGTQGSSSLESAVETIALRTRQLSKRQETWFRKVEDVVWLDMESPEQFPDVARTIASRIDS